MDLTGGGKKPNVKSGRNPNKGKEDGKKSPNNGKRKPKTSKRKKKEEDDEEDDDMNKDFEKYLEQKDNDSSSKPDSCNLLKK